MARDREPHRHGNTAGQNVQTALACAGSIALAVILLLTACTRPVSTMAARPVSDLKRQTEVIDRELAARGEHELRVRVASVTRRILDGGETVDADNAVAIEAEVEAVNTLLSSLKVPLLAPALRFDAAEGRLVW